MLRATLLAIIISVAVSAAPRKESVEYSRPDGRPLLLDLCIPEGSGPFPATVLVHGGGFDQGRRDIYISPLFDVLTNAGYAWFSIDYRLAPQYKLPQALEDVDAALAWVDKHRKDYHLNKNKLILMGESAGGFLVGRAGTQPEAEQKLAAVVDFYGPGDYAALSEERRDHPERFDTASIKRHVAHGGSYKFLGAESLDASGLEKLRSVSPISFVHHGMPPFLLIHGDADEQVSYGQSTMFCDAIKKVGGSCKLVTVPGGHHGMSSWKAPDMQAWKTEMLDWMKRYR